MQRRRSLELEKSRSWVLEELSSEHQREKDCGRLEVKRKIISRVPKFSDAHKNKKKGWRIVHLGGPSFKGKDFYRRVKEY